MTVNKSIDNRHLSQLHSLTC